MNFLRKGSSWQPTTNKYADIIPLPKQIHTDLRSGKIDVDIYTMQATLLKPPFCDVSSAIDCYCWSAAHQLGFGSSASFSALWSCGWRCSLFAWGYPSSVNWVFVTSSQPSVACMRYTYSKLPHFGIRVVLFCCLSLPVMLFNVVPSQSGKAFVPPTPAL